MNLRIGWLYGHEMNIYGDRGNVLALAHRAKWRGIPSEIVTIGIGQAIAGQAIDLFFWGGGQDREQISVAADLSGDKGRPQIGHRGRRSDSGSLWRLPASRPLLPSARRGRLVRHQRAGRHQRGRQ